MKLSDFRIGLEFLDPRGLRCRCTDIGKRTVIAIYLDRDDPIWYQGPPYIVHEMVFDEAYIAKSYPDPLALVEGRLAQARYSAHPGFSASNFVRIVDERGRMATPIRIAMYCDSTACAVTEKYCTPTRLGARKTIHGGFASFSCFRKITSRCPNVSSFAFRLQPKTI